MSYVNEHVTYHAHSRQVSDLQASMNDKHNEKGYLERESTMKSFVGYLFRFLSNKKNKVLSKRPGVVVAILVVQQNNNKLVFLPDSILVFQDGS